MTVHETLENEVNKLTWYVQPQILLHHEYSIIMDDADAISTN